ncbi:MAG: hypothetical protein LBR65_01205 [Culturomica sp.]|nr:hypothetical protein [Culturomica sp.]
MKETHSRSKNARMGGKDLKGHGKSGERRKGSSSGTHGKSAHRSEKNDHFEWEE